MPRKSKTHKQAIKAAERAVAVMDMRRKGVGYREIAKALDMSLGNAYRIVSNQLEKLRAKAEETTREIVDIEKARLDEYQSGLHDAAKAGDVDAVRLAVVIMERRAKLLGLDKKPTEVGGEDVILSINLGTGSVGPDVEQ